MGETEAALSTVGALLDDLAAVIGGPDLPPDRAVARDLLSTLLDKPRFWPTAHRDAAVSADVAARAHRAARDLRGGMPMAYAVGQAAFRHLTLKVDANVLIPRPETELLVDIALGATHGRGRVADVGTGSGAIALALASEGRFDAVIATDISPGALEVAGQNLAAIPADRRGVVTFRQGDLLAPLRGERLSAIVSNPPYIAERERDELPALVRDWEPAVALFSGDDGMHAIARLVAEAADVLDPGGLLVLEIDSRRAATARHMAETNGRWAGIHLRSDLTGRERFLVARLDNQ